MYKANRRPAARHPKDARVSALDPLCTMSDSSCSAHEPQVLVAMTARGELERALDIVRNRKPAITALELSSLSSPFKWLRRGSAASDTHHLGFRRYVADQLGTAHGGYEAATSSDTERTCFAAPPDALLRMREQAGYWVRLAASGSESLRMARLSAARSCSTSIFPMSAATRWPGAYAPILRRPRCPSCTSRRRKPPTPTRP